MSTLLVIHPSALQEQKLNDIQPLPNVDILNYVVGTNLSDALTKTYDKVGLMYNYSQNSQSSQSNQAIINAFFGT